MLFYPTFRSRVPHSSSVPWCQVLFDDLHGPWSLFFFEDDYDKIALQYLSYAHCSVFAHFAHFALWHHGAIIQFCILSSAWPRFWCRSWWCIQFTRWSSSVTRVSLRALALRVETRGRVHGLSPLSKVFVACLCIYGVCPWLCANVSWMPWLIVHLAWKLTCIPCLTKWLIDLWWGHLRTPQLFINYRMKSVAYLPWKRFIYRFLLEFMPRVMIHDDSRDWNKPFKCAPDKCKEPSTHSSNLGFSLKVHRPTGPQVLGFGWCLLSK